MADEKYQVRWFKGKAHLSEDGRKTFCGQRIQHAAGWTTDQDATIQEYIKYVRPRCSGCKSGAEVHVLIEKMANEQ